MLDFSHLTPSTLADVQQFVLQKTGALQYYTWQKPRGRTMSSMLCIGPGGNGGNGAIGANSTAAGGGGGGSGAVSKLMVPINLLPDQLYIIIDASNNVYISVSQFASVNERLLFSRIGGTGGNAAGATAGAAGAAAAIPLITECVLAGMGIFTFLAGQAGIIGGVAVAGAALTLPTTGLTITGGTGGGGLPAAAATGTNGGSFTVPAVPSIFPPQSGGIGSATATVPAASGSHGYPVFKGYWYGGCGGASTHGTATGAGLQQSSGGDGGIGSGGGGSGGALTGSAAGKSGIGGPGLVQIVCW